ncbi:MAG: TonB-dependent receptor, partial [Chitinophagaceae bacterium]
MLLEASLVFAFQQYPDRTGGTPHSVRGVVYDAATHLPLSGATISIPALKTGAISEANGNYLIRNVPDGTHAVEVSFIGYATLHLTIVCQGPVEKDFFLETSVLENNEVVVTGVSQATEQRRTPTPVLVVKRQELTKTTATNLVDLLSRKPGIAQVSSGPAISKPVIRGLGYNRVVVLNDGVRQEGQQWGDEHGLEVDEYSVQKVEILKGPASLMYGSDALAGVINIITNTPVAQGSLSGSLSALTQTNNHLLGRSFQLGAYHNNGFNWNVYASGKQAQDYRNRYDGRVFNSKFTEQNIGGYFGWNKSWGYSHFIVSSFRQRAGIIFGERDAEGYFLKWLPDGGTARVTSSDLSSVIPRVPWEDIRHLRFITDHVFSINNHRANVNVAWQQNLRTEYGNAENLAEKELQFKLGTLTYTAQLQLQKTSTWSSTVGTNGMWQLNKNQGIDALIPDYHLWDGGFFYYLKHTKGPFSWSGGLRYDFRTIQSSTYLEDNAIKFGAFRKTFSNISGSIGLSYVPSKAWVVKWNFARGFRAPTVAELLSNGAHEGSNRYEYGNTDLRSEKSWQTDVGVEWLTEHLALQASGFVNAVEKFIFYQKLPAAAGGDSLIEEEGRWLPAFRFNQRNVILYGGELSADLHPHPLDWLHFENSLSLVYARFLTPLE